MRGMKVRNVDRFFEVEYRGKPSHRRLASGDVLHRSQLRSFHTRSPMPRLTLWATVRYLTQLERLSVIQTAFLFAGICPGFRSLSLPYAWHDFAGRWAAAPSDVSKRRSSFGDSTVFASPASSSTCKPRFWTQL